MKKLLGIGLLLALLGLGAAYYMYNKPHQNMLKAKADVVIPATELFAAFESNEAEANRKYLDKVVKVTGIVKEAGPNDDGAISVVLESGSALSGVICELDNLSEQKRTTFEVGEQLTFKGICTGMLMDVVLVRCVLE